SQIAPWELGISSGSNDNMSGNNYAPTSDSIGCPYYDSLNERMIAGILLYDAMFSLAKSDGRKNAQDLPTFYKDAIDTFFGSCLKGSCEIRLSSLKCYVADFIKSDLDGFDNKNLSLRQKIKHFLSLEIVGREVNDCDILVRGLPNKYSDHEDVEDAGARADDSTKA